ncbi:hypothetical protein VTI74DRAFT_4575 [Chaetomium olivicolor]
MVGYGSPSSATRSSNRVRPCGLRIKTNLVGMADPSSKSSAISSTDWRKRAAISSPGGTTKESAQARRKQLFDENEDICIRLDFDLDRSGPQYRHPRNEKVPWDAVVSAPSWKLPSSVSSISGDDLEVIKVQLKHVNPMVTSVNGEDIALPNRFSLDVIPVDPDDASSWVTLAELRPLDGLNRFRRIRSDDSDAVLTELQEALSRTQETSSSVASTAGSQSEKVGSDSADSVTSTAAVGFCHAKSVPTSEEEARFQRLLSRLEKSQPEPAHKTEAPRAVSGQVVDPAIVAMKVKDDVQGAGVSTGAVDKEAANHYLAQQLNHMRNPGHQQSVDSGYGSNESLRNTNGPSNAALGVLNNASQHTRKESSDGQAKSLNPAAAEFKSKMQNDAVARFSPKKLSRPPLANIFPDALTGQLPLPQAVAPRRLLPGQAQQTTGGPGAQHPALPPGIPAINNSTLTNAVLPGLQQTLQAPGLGSINGLPGGLATLNTLPQQIVSMPATALPSGVLPVNLSAVPSAAPLNAQVPISQMAIPSSSVFHTFPPAAGGPSPLTVLNQTAPVGLNPSCLTLSTNPFPTAGAFLTTPQQQQQAHSQAAAAVVPTANASVVHNGTGSSSSAKPPPRPYFPVTTKPRDHDPVKQQMYEAYLEWRKANEPGYHMKCKMRQAQRALRQTQLLQAQQQQQQLGQTDKEGRRQQTAAQGGGGDSDGNDDAGRQQQQQQQQRKGLVEGCHHGGRKAVPPPHHGTNNNKEGSGGGNGTISAAAWKAVAEKAKAAVSARAAAAMAEREKKKEQVREELKAKVRELSREMKEVKG